jgi:uncharacterized protein
MNFENSNLAMIFFGLFPLYLIITVVLFYFVNKFLKNKNKIFNAFNYVIFVPVIILLSLGIYAHYIERFNLQVDTYKIKSGYKARLAVITDPHLGRFKDERYLQVVVDRINTIPDLDAVLIPGDFTYWPDINKLPELYAPFKNLKVPAYAVLGNHDVEKPGPKLDQELIAALTQDNVTLVDNKTVSLKLRSGTEVSLIGLKDFWLDDYNINNIRSIQEQNVIKNYIVMAHQPDVIRSFDKLSNIPKLTITGHTHCGQVRIPGMYNSHLPTIDHYFDKGFYKALAPFETLSNPQSSEYSKLFISCGVGEVGLPIRFNNPPVIDVLELVE